MAFRDTTPWASFLPLIGDMMVLAHAVRARRRRDLSRQRRQQAALCRQHRARSPVSGARRRRSTWIICASSAPTVVFRVYPELDHSTEWWPDERPTFESFVHDHPREPLPDRISWQTERVDRFNRAHWLVIDRLGSRRGREPPARHEHAAARARARFRPAHQLGRRSRPSRARGRAGSNAFSIGLRAGDRFVEVNGKPVETGRDIAEGMETWTIGRSRAIRGRARRRSHGAGRSFEPDGGRLAADADLPAAQAVGSRRSRAARKCCGGVDRRRESIYAAAVAVDLRLPAPRHGRRERAHGRSRAWLSRAWRRC